MALFKRRSGPAGHGPAPCPACGEPLVPDHCTEVHTQELPTGEFIFVCSCGVSTRKWEKQFGAGESMEIHLDHDHGTNVSGPAELGMLRDAYTAAFPDGQATQ